MSAKRYCMDTNILIYSIDRQAWITPSNGDQTGSGNDDQRLRAYITIAGRILSCIDAQGKNAETAFNSPTDCQP